jgi:ribose transport system permease protein
MVVIVIISAAELLFKGRLGFLAADSLITMSKHTMMVGIGAIGMTLIMISGGIDLSVGSGIALTAVTAAWVLREGSPPNTAELSGAGAVYLPILALGAAIVTGALIGFLNGGLITRLKMVPFIVTLGMMGIARGAAKFVASNQKIDAPWNWLRNLPSERPEPPWIVLPWGVWLMVFLALGIWAMLRFTRFGRHIYAVGSNENTARLCGVRVRLVRLMVYVLSGCFVGLAGIINLARQGSGDPTTAVGAELDIIAAVVIGGGSLAGGEGSVWGSLIGAFLMAALRKGCVQLDLPDYTQEIVIGGIIILAVALDQLRHRREA